MRENGPLLSRVVDPPGTKGGPRAGNFPGPPKNTFCPGWSHHPGQKGLLSRVVAPLGTKAPLYNSPSSPPIPPTLRDFFDFRQRAVVPASAAAVDVRRPRLRRPRPPLRARIGILASCCKKNSSFIVLVLRTALDMEDLMVEDLLDDVVIQIVLESIDEWLSGANYCFQRLELWSNLFKGWAVTCYQKKLRYY